MRLLWTFVKVVLGLALAVPLAIIVLATALGLFGALVGLAFFALRIAIVGLMVYGVFRLVRWLFRHPTPAPQPRLVQDAPRPDPHYEAAMRELDRELGVR
jgi:hypothetical protein